MLDRIQREGGVSIAELAQSHDVSTITVHRDLAALQQHVVDGTLREAAAHRKSRVPRTDDDGGDDVNRAVSSWRHQERRDQFTWTLTFVGLVTMS